MVEHGHDHGQTPAVGVYVWRVLVSHRGGEQDRPDHIQVSTLQNVYRSIKIKLTIAGLFMEKFQ